MTACMPCECMTAGHTGELPGLHHDAIAVEGLIPVHVGHLEVAHVGELGGKRAHLPAPRPAEMGRPYLRANSKSRWSPQGTAMTAPVP